jgi:hypothetical protein
VCRDGWWVGLKEKVCVRKTSDAGEDFLENESKFFTKIKTYFLSVGCARQYFTIQVEINEQALVPLEKIKRRCTCLIYMRTA